VLEVKFSAPDVANTRMAISPLWEIVVSVRVLKDPCPVALHVPWREDALQRLNRARIDTTLLFDLIPPVSSYIPDFLAPSPERPIPDLAAELECVRSTEPELVRADIDRITHPRTAAVEALYRDPVRELAKLTATMQSYWDIALAPHWDRILHLLDGEVLYRSRRLAEGGAQRLFADLNPNVRWDGDTLYVTHKTVNGKFPLNGRGLVLTPSVFAWPDIFSVVEGPWQPTLLYPARGLFTLWEERSRRKTSGGLARVIGKSRASLLSELDAPRSTTQLAELTGLTAGGVSQHLSALQAAGFVDAHRRGRAVLYARTAIADALMD
jgi:DNA-binding transcriptional ArsR family regulator